MKYKEIDALIVLFEAVREGIVTDEEFDRLNRMLSQDKRVCKLYYEYVKMTCNLKTGYADEQPCSVPPYEPSFDRHLWQSLAEHEKTARTLHFAAQPDNTERPKIEPIKNSNVVYFQIKKSSILTLIAAAAVILIVVLFDRLVPVQSVVEVAALTDALDLKWSLDEAPLAGHRLSVQKKPIQINEGIARLVTVEGVELFIESPAEFRFITSCEVQLHYGRLLTRLGESSSGGFAVTTSNARIVDRGTEFGILAHINGDTELHVFQGRTVLTSTSSKTGQEPHFVESGDAMRVDSYDASITPITLNKKPFVFGLDSASKRVWRGERRLDMTDIACGGDGLGTGDRKMALDIRTGKLTPRILAVGGTHELLPLPESPFLDAVFTPNPSLGPVRVSTGGHLFNDCPPCFSDAAYNLIAGVSHELEMGPDAADEQVLRPTNAPASTPMLLMHANLGLTFDLQAIRAAFPGNAILAFKARCGYLKKIPAFHTQDTVRQWLAAHHGDPDYVPRSDFFVLLDGEKRFETLDVTYKDEWVTIDIPLSSSDRFLTLITSDGSDDDPTYNWTMFIEPVLELAASP